MLAKISNIAQRLRLRCPWPQTLLEWSGLRSTSASPVSPCRATVARIELRLRQVPAGSGRDSRWQPQLHSGPPAAAFRRAFEPSSAEHFRPKSGAWLPRQLRKSGLDCSTAVAGRYLGSCNSELDTSISSHGKRCASFGVRGGVSKGRFARGAA